MHVITYKYRGTIRHRRSVAGTGETEHSHNTTEEQLARFVIAGDNWLEKNMAMHLINERNRSDENYEFLGEVSCDRIDAILSVKTRLP